MLTCTNFDQSKKLWDRKLCGNPAIAYVNRSLMPSMQLCRECAEQMEKDGMLVHYYKETERKTT